MNQLALPLPTPKPEHTALVARVLGQHRGVANGIGVRALALAAMITERAVRVAVTELRMQGIAVCGRPDTGYYLATSAQELEPTLKLLRSRAITSLVLESRLSKTAFADLVGQLRVPT